VTFPHLASVVIAFPTVVGASTLPPACSPTLLCFAVDSHPALLLPLAPPPVPLDAAGTAAPKLRVPAGHWGRCTCAHAWRRRQAPPVLGEAPGPSAEALRPRLLLWLRRPDANNRGGRIEIRCIFQAYISNVSDVLEVYYKCFIRILQESISMLHILQWLYPYVANICS
jgi:hypothetical protein